MPQTFTDAIAESREEFLDLVREARATYYEVYSGTPDSASERLFEGAIEDELLLRFDLRNHSEGARARFRELTDLERRAYEFPADLAEKPIPYFGSFVTPFGKVGIAWTREEIADLITRTRKEMVLAEQARGRGAKRGGGGA